MPPADLRAPRSLAPKGSSLEIRHVPSSNRLFFHATRRPVAPAMRWTAAENGPSWTKPPGPARLGSELERSAHSDTTRNPGFQNLISHSHSYPVPRQGIRPRLRLSFISPVPGVFFSFFSSVGPTHLLLLSVD